MDQFSRWTRVAHSHLSNHQSKIKLGHVQQILAACLGHRTYASLRKGELATLNQLPKYVLFDHEAGRTRAASLDIALSQDEWWKLVHSITPNGVTPFWLTDIRGMTRAAELAFLDTPDDRLQSLKLAIGLPEASRVLSTERRLTDYDDGRLVFDVEGELIAYTQENYFAIPLGVVIEFTRLGRLMYREGVIVEVQTLGTPRTLSPDELPDDDGDFYWMSED